MMGGDTGGPIKSVKPVRTRSKLRNWHRMYCSMPVSQVTAAALRQLKAATKQLIYQYNFPLLSELPGCL